MAAISLDKSILEDFVRESLILVEECLELLESIENDPSEVGRLDDFANRIDRVMGGAKSLALLADPEHALNLVGDYCAICKSVGYQGSKIVNNDQLYNVTVALLLDAVEMTKILLNRIETSATELKKIFSITFLERLKWISLKFDEIAQKTAEKGQQLQQNEIDELLKKLGLD